MIPINLMTTLQILIDPVEGYYLQQYYGSFSQGKPSSTVFKGILVILCYTVFQYVKKQILPGSHSPWKIATDLLLTLCFLLLLTICLYRDLGIFRIFLAVSFMAIREAGRIIALILPYLTTLPTSFPGWRQIYGHTVSEQNAFFFVLLTVHGMWILIYGFCSGQIIAEKKYSSLIFIRFSACLCLFCCFSPWYLFYTESDFFSVWPPSARNRTVRPFWKNS